MGSRRCSFRTFGIVVWCGSGARADEDAAVEEQAEDADSDNPSGDLRSTMSQMDLMTKEEEEEEEDSLPTTEELCSWLTCQNGYSNSAP